MKTTSPKRRLYAFILLSCLACHSALSQTIVRTFIQHNIKYELKEVISHVDNYTQRYATVMGWGDSNKSSNLVIPFQVIGSDNKVYNISAIDKEAFCDSPNLKYVTLNCSGITEIPESVLGKGILLEVLNIQNINQGWNLCKHIRTKYLYVKPGTYNKYLECPEFRHVDIIDLARNPDKQDKTRKAGAESYIYSNIPAKRWERCLEGSNKWEIIENTKSYYIDRETSPGKVQYRVIDKNNICHPVITIRYE